MSKKIEWTDVVNHPSHYKLMDNLEVYDVIDAVLGKVHDGKEGWLLSNVLKYTMRYKEKGGVESLQKAEWYLNKLCIYLEDKEEG
jgi:hypothetical protein